MHPGDYVLIEPHCRHRVAWTHADEQTVWLAIYYER
jgi:cupin 2 domain-containing protein